MRIKIPLTAALALVLLAAPFAGASNGYAAACGTTYTVRAGDSLSAIATNCGVNYQALLSANPGITTPDLIAAGQVINIPAASTPPSSIPVTGSSGAAGTYTVKEGDSLSLIASNNNVGLLALEQANPSITNADLIVPGQVINLPASGAGIPVTGGNPNAGRTYTVQAGDTLGAIAVANNTTVSTLLSSNTWITNPDLIFPGQVVNLP